MIKKLEQLCTITGFSNLRYCVSARYKRRTLTIPIESHPVLFTLLHCPPFLCLASPHAPISTNSKSSTYSQRPSDSRSVTCSPGPRRLVHRVTEYPGTTALPGQSDATLPLAAATKPWIVPAHVLISRPAGQTTQDETNKSGCWENKA